MRGQVSVDVRARPVSGPDESSPARGPQAASRHRGLSRHGAVRGGLRGHRGRARALWVDSALHTAPAFLLVGLGLGLAAAALSVIKQIRTYL